MASTLDPNSFSENGTGPVKGHDTRSLGPSDSSDSGSDVAGPSEDDLFVDADTDRHGTGERISVGNEGDVDANADITPDRIVTAREAGLGGGLDEAEEARLGITDEELSEDVDENPPVDHKTRPRRHRI